MTADAKKVTSSAPASLAGGIMQHGKSHCHLCDQWYPWQTYHRCAPPAILPDETPLEHVRNVLQMLQLLEGDVVVTIRARLERVLEQLESKQLVCPRCRDQRNMISPMYGERPPVTIVVHSGGPGMFACSWCGFTAEVAP